MAQLVRVHTAKSNRVRFLELMGLKERIHSHKLSPDRHTKPRHTQCPSPTHRQKEKQMPKKCPKANKNESYNLL